jgi:ornithine cyclodeaminase/alanine dehydrogenase-like protein (mu-crystallin family)
MSGDGAIVLSGNAPLLYASEQAVAAIVRQCDVTEAIAEAFIEHAAGMSANYPVVRELLGVHDAIFGFKSGFDRNSGVLGVKAGGLWPGNQHLGLPNHQSTTLLFDPATGAPCALLGTTKLTALRTAAASALSIRMLAREDSSVLGIIGAGGQSEAQVRAALTERPFKHVLVADRSADRASALVDRLMADGIHAAVCDVSMLCQRSDVIITVTPARAAVLSEADVRPGTHLACMGADTVGKQEVPSSLVARVSLFGDEPQQAVTIGECQHAFKEGRIAIKAITRIGDVLSGAHPGRLNDQEITLFDGTGIAVQDLAAASVALRAVQNAGRAMVLPE